MKKSIMAIPFTCLLAACSTNNGGPIGFGNIEVGQSRAAIESINNDESVYLTSSLSPTENKALPNIPGIKFYDAKIKTQFSNYPLKSTMDFSNGKLNGITIEFEPGDESLEIITKSIIAKYGHPVETGSIEEETCRLTNGSSVIARKGYARKIWKQKKENIGIISTIITNVTSEKCVQGRVEVIAGEVNAFRITGPALDNYDWETGKMNAKSFNPF